MTDIFANPGNYKKLWAVLIGYLIGWIFRTFGVDLGPEAGAVIDITFGLVTAFFVWLLPNVRRLFHQETTTVEDTATGTKTVEEVTVAEVDVSGEPESVKTEMKEVLPVTDPKP
jgi:uncharacterized membrane protein YeaQ/YmgE (transglycosylase-associated protein family)